MSLQNVLDGKSTKVSVSATAPGTSRKAILNDSEQPWTSPSIPGHIHLSFPAIEGASHIALTFQGGFVGIDTEVWVAETSGGNTVRQVGNIYPEDKSKRQVFPIPTATAEWELTELKLAFLHSSDNQGRITLYQVEILRDVSWQYDQMSITQIAEDEALGNRVSCQGVAMSNLMYPRGLQRPGESGLPSFVA